MIYQVTNRYCLAFWLAVGLSAGTFGCSLSVPEDEDSNADTDTDSDTDTDTD